MTYINLTNFVRNRLRDCSLPWLFSSQVYALNVISMK